MTSVSSTNTRPGFSSSSPLDLAIRTIDAPSAMTNPGISAGSRPPGLPLPHVDDITAYPRDIDLNQSIKKLLEAAEAALRSAETSRGFKRPATALKDYIKASCICVIAIKNHRDYPTLHGGWGDLTRQHNSLLQRIHALHSEYEKIKLDIKADNLRTGAVAGASKAAVAPRTSDAPTFAANHQESNMEKMRQNRLSQPPLNFHGKAKPAIQPKPEALHGNVISNGHSRSSSSVDLSRDIIASRLAALRGPQSSPGQDPRIKTHAIVPPKPAGPRSMPPSGKPILDVNSSVSGLPRMPDAIYSPVRGTVTEEAAKLPSSTPRGLFSRTGSSASITSGASTPTQLSYADSFPSPKFATVPRLTDQHSMDSASSASSPKVSIDISTGETIDVERLYGLMKARLSILIVDIRPRDEFDEGHIMSTSTICVEPDILIRENLSCDQISESLVLSPDSEQSVFDKRNEYDLLVVYDQNSGAISRPPRNQSDVALVSFFRALVHLNYGRELKQPPKLLEGGIDAWVDLLGPAALQSTSASSARTARLRLGHQGGLGRRKSKYVGKPMKPDDVIAWQATVNQDDEMTASSPSFHRTTEDFIRRFPAISLEQESMTSPAVRPLQLSDPAQGPTGPSEWQADTPNPPTRPDRAMPRRNYNGLSQESGQNGDGSGPGLATGRGNAALDGPRSPVEKTYTALHNPINWCYANSVLQALFASHFARALRGQNWKMRFKVPMKKDEKIPQPQLMMQILANLFHWMSTGNFKVMKAHTLMNYSQHVTKQIRHAQVFGNSQQHDAQEFLQFILEQVDDETNRNRDREGLPPTPALQDVPLNHCQEIAKTWWNAYSETHNSIVDEHFRFIRATHKICGNRSCSEQAWEWAPETFMACLIGERVDSLARALDDMITDTFDFVCDECKTKAQQHHRIHFYHLPPILCFALQRHDQIMGRKISFELDNFDMSRWGTAPGGASNIYECFAIVKHEGKDMNSGHYKCFVRAPASSSPSRWILFNDSATPIVMDTKQLLKSPERVFETAYILLYRRKDGSDIGV